MSVLIATFESDEEAKEAYKALIRFFDREVEYYNIFKCCSEGPLSFDGEAQAQRFVEEMIKIAENYGGKDRIKAEARLHNVNIDYGMVLTRGSYSKEDVRLIGRTVRIEEGLTLSRDGGKKVINLLKAKGGLILMSPYTWR